MPANRITQFEFYCSHAKLIVLNKNILKSILKLKSKVIPTIAPQNCPVYNAPLVNMAS